MPRFTRLDIKTAQVARLKLLAEAEEHGVAAGPDRTGPFTYVPQRSGEVRVLFRQVVVASVKQGGGEWGVAVRNSVNPASDAVIAAGVMGAIAVTDEVGRIKRAGKRERQDYAASVAAPGGYLIGGWDLISIQRALLGLVDHRPGEMALCFWRDSVIPDIIRLNGARPYSFRFHQQRGACQVSPVYAGGTGHVMAQEHLVPLLEEGLARTEAAINGPPAEAFAPLALAERADPLSIKFHSANAPSEIPWRTRFGDFGLNFHDPQVMSLSHGGVIFASQRLEMAWPGGQRRLSFNTTGKGVNKHRADLYLGPIDEPHLRWALLSASFAHVGQNVDDLVFPEEHEINDEALRLGF